MLGFSLLQGMERNIYLICMPGCNANVCEKCLKTHLNMFYIYIFIEGHSGG